MIARLLAWFALHWGIVAVIALAVVERLLMKSKNPAARSTVSLIALLLRSLVTMSRIALIPIVGAFLVRALEAIAGVDLDGDGKIGEPVPVEEDITKPGVPPPDLPKP